MSAAVAAAATAAQGYQHSRSNSRNSSTPEIGHAFIPRHKELSLIGRYESQKRRDWNTFRQYLRNHRPTVTVSRCSEAHVIEFLNYLDQFGKIKIHGDDCGHNRTQDQSSCSCPLRQAWVSVDGLIGRLFAAYEDNGGLPGRNPFGARAVRLYLVEVRESQAKVRGIVKS